jgi:hypothetical protein
MNYGHTSDSKVASTLAVGSPGSARPTLTDVKGGQRKSTHLTQQIGFFVGSHKVGDVVRIFGSWDVVLSKTHLQLVTAWQMKSADEGKQLQEQGATPGACSACSRSTYRLNLT